MLLAHVFYQNYQILNHVLFAAKKMTNRQVEMFARIHVAVRASYFDAFEVDGTDTTNEDKERLVKAVHSFAEKTAKGQPMNFGKNSEIIDYVKKHF